MTSMWRFFITRDQLATVSRECVCLSELRSRLWSGLNLEAETKQPPNVWSNKRYFWPGAIKLSENIRESSRNDLINKPTQVRPQISKTLTSIKPEPTHLDSMPPHPTPTPKTVNTLRFWPAHSEKKRFRFFFLPLPVKWICCESLRRPWGFQAAPDWWCSNSSWKSC